jgi:methylthioribose-1-phosphate isomerase
MMLPYTIQWNNNCPKAPSVTFLDQRHIPERTDFVTCSSFEEVAVAIEDMVLRGAPLIGVAAAYGAALAAKDGKDSFSTALKRLAATRPTAVNLIWALRRMERATDSIADDSDLFAAAVREAVAIHEEDKEINRKLGFNGQTMLPEKAVVITYCNAGALATSEYGTALGVFRAARENGKELKVYACETRPRLQGGRLTSYELLQDEFDVTVICDSMAAFLMSRMKVDAVVTGADRIALNGDSANKIGTYSLAISAHRHGVPFYIAAPVSTIDLDCKTGADIPIEMRDGDEVRKVSGNYIMPRSVKVWNPSFDVTPAELITAIITERGVIVAPYSDKILKITG